MSIKVAIDLLSTIPGKSGATGIWVSMLNKYPELAPEIEFYVFVTPTLKKFYLEHIPSPKSNLHFVDVSFGSGRARRLIFREFSIPRLCQQFKIDVHYTCSPVPVLRPLKAREVWKVTALQPFHFPGQVGYVRSAYHRLTFKKKAARSAIIIANSEFTKREIIRLSGVDDDRVKVIYESVDHKIFNRDSPCSQFRNFLKEKVGFCRDYILWVSEIRPYKNPISFLKAFKNVLMRHNIPHNVIMIGNDVLGYRSKVQRAVKELGIAERVRFLDSIARDKLVGFYRCADLFVYLSSFETFGIPPLEAMACGTPVIASDKSAVPEIVGDGALIVDPTGIDALSEAIWSVISSRSLAENLVHWGAHRAAQFSWERNAKETMSVFKQVASNV